MNVDVPGPTDVAHELDSPRAVDEIEEDELPHLATCHDAAREAPLQLQLSAGLERLDLGPNGRDVVPVGEALRRGHRAESTRP